MLKFDLKRCFLRQKLPKISRASRADNLKSSNFSNSPRGGVSKIFACGAICVGGFQKFWPTDQYLWYFVFQIILHEKRQ